MRITQKGHIKGYNGCYNNPEYILKQREAKLGKNNGNWKGGVSVYLKKEEGICGENNPNWKGGVTTLRERLRRHKQYRGWRLSVLNRDNYTCIYCGDTNKLRIHHIISLRECMDYGINELMYDPNNGETVCEDCHKGIHKGDRQ